MQGFGYNNRNMDELFGRLLRSAPKMDLISAQLLLREAYQEAYGIVNYSEIEDNKRPMVAIGLHPKEDFVATDRIMELLERYLLQELNGKLGISFLEYLDMPGYRHRQITRVLDKHEQIRKRLKDQAKAEAEAERNGNKKVKNQTVTKPPY